MARRAWGRGGGGDKDNNSYAPTRVASMHTDHSDSADSL